MGATRASSVDVLATGMRGPGRLAAYLTGTFGEVEHYFDSEDGFRGRGGHSHPSRRRPHPSQLGFH